MGKPETGMSPAEQVRRKGIQESFKRRKEPGALKGKVYLFDHSHVVYDPLTGLIEIIKATRPEKEVGGVVESTLAPAGKMTLPIAIAQTLNIADQFVLDGGEVTEKDRKVLAKTLEMLDWWNDVPVTEEERQLKEHEVGELLETSGYNNARDRHRRVVAEQLWAGSGRDSLDRINPGAKQAQLAVAERSGRRRAVKNKAIFEKYGLRLLPALVTERNQERKRIRQGVIAIENLLNTLSRPWESYEGRLKSFLKRFPTIISLHCIRISPFVYPAAEALAELVYDLDEGEENRLLQVLGKEKIAELRRDSSVEKLLNSAQYAPIFVRQGVVNKLEPTHAKLVQVLEDEEQVMLEERMKRQARLEERGIGV